MSRTEITSEQIRDGVIINDDISLTAAISGTKITPSFGSQNITTTGSISVGDANLSGDATLTGKAIKFVTNSQITSIQGNSLASSSVVYSLPVSAGTSGQALITDGSGGLSWGTVSSGVTYPLTATDGSVSLPSYSFSGDTSTGVYHPGSGIIGVTTNGVERLRVDGSGYVTVGGASAYAKLSVADSLSVRNASSSASLYIEAISAGTSSIVLKYAGSIYGTIVSDTVDSYKLKIKAGSSNSITATTGGYVGIMTTTPDTTLHVAGSIKMVDGNQAAGKLMTSDANGVGSWVTFTETDPVVKAINGIVKSDGTTISAATAGTDYVVPSGVFPISNSPSSDHTASGIVITGTAGEAISAGNVCYRNSAGTYYKALASAVGTMPGCVIATADIASAASGTFLQVGTWRDDSAAYTVGGTIYVSGTTSGALTQTKPSTSGHQIQIVGYAISSTVMFVNPNLMLIQVA